MNNSCPVPELVPGVPEDILLSVQDVRVWFELRRFGLGVAGYVRAVDGVRFDLRQGEAIAIVGESGCGKSSLMRTILGLHRPKEGCILFDGRDISHFSRKELFWYRTRVGYVQQDPYGALPPFMSTQALLEEPLIVARIQDRRQRLERIHKAMEEVKITPVEDFISKFPHQLSGGQQQRVVIARAILMDPRLLVADEPVSMLDASVRVEILTLLRELQERRRLSVMYITHDLSTVRYFSERIFVMYAGKIVEKGPVDDLIYHPRHPYTWALLAAIPEPDAENVKRFRKVPPGEPPSLIHPPPGCRFHPRCERMIAGLCDAQEPPEFEAGPQHQVACWLYR
ncbi:MAG: ABC transporter ATP-binding protein [Anaerolineae bacterium]